MESPGACIRRERELRGFSIQDVHRATRIPVKILVALEADDYESLPQEAFVKGYIKACCKFMGLDETDLLLRYELYIKENAPREKAPESEREPAPLAERPSALNSRNVVGLLLVVGLLIITGFYFLRGRGGDEALVKSRLPAAGTVESEKSGSEGQKAPAPTGPSGAKPSEEAAVPAPGAGKAEEPLAQHPLAERSAVEEAAAAPGHVLKVIATDKVWIRFAIDGRKPFEVLFRKGEDRHWLMKKGVSLVIGNAAGATIVFDGKPVTLPKEEGRVIRLNLPGSWKGSLKTSGRAASRGPAPGRRSGASKKPAGLAGHEKPGKEAIGGGVREKMALGAGGRGTGPGAFNGKGKGNGKGKVRGSESAGQGAEAAAPEEGPVTARPKPVDVSGGNVGNGGNGTAATVSPAAGGPGDKAPGARAMERPAGAAPRQEGVQAGGEAPGGALSEEAGGKQIEEGAVEAPGAVVPGASQGEAADRPSENRGQGLEAESGGNEEAAPSGAAAGPLKGEAGRQEDKRQGEPAMDKGILKNTESPPPPEKNPWADDFI